MNAPGLTRTTRALRLMTHLCQHPQSAAAVADKFQRARWEAKHRGWTAFAHALETGLHLASQSAKLKHTLDTLAALQRTNNTQKVDKLRQEVQRLDMQLMKDRQTTLTRFGDIMGNVLAGDVATRRTMSPVLPAHGRISKGTSRKFHLARHFVKHELCVASQAVNTAKLHEMVLHQLRQEKPSSAAKGKARESRGVDWRMKPFSTRPWRWLGHADGIGSNGNCFFDSVIEALKRDTERPRVNTDHLTAQLLRKMVANHVCRRVGTTFPGVDLYAHQVQGVDRKLVPTWLRPLAQSVHTAGTTPADHQRVLTKLMLDKGSYWADEAAIAFLSEQLNIMIMVVDAHRDMNTAEKRFQVNTVFVHERAPTRIIVVKLSGSVNSNQGHYQPLINTTTGRGCWTPSSLPEFLSTRFRHGLIKSPWFHPARLMSTL